MSLTDAQHKMLGALDDAVEHLRWEFDRDKYRGPSTCGFARITGISGNSSFYRSVVSLSNVEGSPVRKDPRDSSRYIIEVGGVTMTLSKDYNGGFSLSVQPKPLLDGPDVQRLDAKERIHRLVLNRLQLEHGYLDDARVHTRMD